MKKSKRKMKVITSSLLAITLALSSIAVSSAATGKYQDEMTVSAVNFESVWGDKAANIDKMTEKIEMAADDGTNLILFPEMCVTGYSTGLEYLGTSTTPMPVELAEDMPGPTSNYFSSLADKYNMYIVYGATQKIAGDSEHAYNVAVACSPDGSIDVYQKIHPYETDWCVAGTQPVYFETEWGPIGLSICYDTYATPELQRIYSASGCRMVLNPTALSDDGDWGWDWYYQNRLEYCSEVNDFYVVSANLVGKDGPDGIRHFPGGALVMGPSETASSMWDEDYIKYYAGGVYNTSKNPVTATVDLSRAILSNTYTTYAEGGNSDLFVPEIYSNWYSELTEMYNNGFTVPEPASSENPTVAVVTMDPVWGDKDANFIKMKSYIEDAASQGVNILQFPEMALTDYSGCSDPTSPNYIMPVTQAETTDGYYPTEISKLAQQYNMYIIYGTPEKIEGETEHAYNSAFVATPQGETLSYKKIQPVEGDWATPGTEPLIVETPWGAMGLSICMDTYVYPELERYYAGKGCRFLMNPTATNVPLLTDTYSSHYYNTTLDAIASRDGMTVLSSNLCGDYHFDNVYSMPVDGFSVIIEASSAKHLNEQTNSEGMWVSEVNMENTGLSVFLGFKPQAFAESYAKLAAGTPVYVSPGLKAEPVTTAPVEETTVEAPTETAEPTTIADATSATGATESTTSVATADNASGDAVQTGAQNNTIYLIVLLVAAGVVAVAYNRKRLFK